MQDADFPEVLKTHAAFADLIRLVENAYPLDEVQEAELDAFRAQRAFARFIRLAEKTSPEDKAQKAELLGAAAEFLRLFTHLPAKEQQELLAYADRLMMSSSLWPIAGREES